jgi:hypothetical protein
MKTIPLEVRMFQSIRGLAMVIGFCASGICVEAQMNSWTSPGSGNWEDLTWSLGVRPGVGQQIFITNANWKAVQLTAATAQNFPQSLMVDSVTVFAPDSFFNTFYLNNVGVPSPLLANQVTVGSNAAVLMLSSAIQANYLTVNGAFNQGFYSGVTVTNDLNLGDGAPGTYSLTNGTLTVLGTEAIGVTARSTFNQEGGFHYANLLSVGSGTFYLRGGQLGGNVQVAGGTLDQTGGDLSPASLHVDGGSLVQNGGTGTIGPTTVGTMSPTPNPPSHYILSNGVPTFSSDLTINSLGVFDQEGGSNTINGTLSVLTDATFPDHPVIGAFLLNGGMLSPQGFFLSGTYSQGGGTIRVAGDLTISSSAVRSRCVLTGGWLVTSNTTMLDGDANIIQTGGRHQVSGTLRVTGGTEPAYGLYGGQVIAPTIEIRYGTFAHWGGTVTNTVLLRLDGWWDEFVGNQQFGQLQIGASGISSLWFGTNAAILRFANSSGQAWDSGGILHVRNWSGSLSGGGGNQIIFGNSSAALTPAQVGQIRFDYFPSTEYTAKILPTGEVVPNPSGPPYAPDGLGAQGISANQINLTWTDNSIDETGFAIERSPDGTNFAQVATVAANTTSYSDTGLSPITAYFYRVRAYNGSGDSSYTSVAEASTKANGQPPLAGMVAWWPAENSADDVIGNHNGTTPYGIAYAPGKSGQAFDFEASNSRVFVPDSPDFVPTNGFTFEGWFYARQTLDSYIGMRGDDRGGFDAWVVRRLSDGQLSFEMDGLPSESVVIETPVQNNQWCHFAATFDSATSEMKLYINGALAANADIPFQPIGAYDPGWDPGIGIGNQSGTINRTSFDGLIDDVALYSRALSPLEIQAIYNAGAGGKASLGQTGTNAWTSSVSGNWEDSSWSLGKLPNTGQSILITNSGWKAVQLSANTAQNFPQSLNVDSITVSSPANTVNTLFLNNVGVASPLTMKSFTLGSNSVVTLLSSALQSISTFDIGGTFNQGDFSGVTAGTLRIGNIGPATYNLTNGTLAALQFEQLGGFGYPSVFNQDGGYHYAVPLWIDPSGEYNLRGGQLGGSVLLNGGTLNQTGGDFRQNDLFVTGAYWLNGGTIEASNQIGIQMGTVIQNGGTNTSGLLQIVTALSETGIDSPVTGSYVLSNGVLHVSDMNIGFWGYYEQDGGVSTVDDSIVIPAYFVGPKPGFEVAGYMYINGGILSVGNINTTGRISQTGGTNEVRGDLVFGGWSPSEYDLSGGLLTTSNTTMIQAVGQGFHQSGGRHVVANRLQFAGSYTRYFMSGGELVAPEIDVIGSVFDHTDGVVSNSTLLAMDSSSWSESTAAQAFGQLQLNGASNSASGLVLPSSGGCVVRFADSSSRAWSNGVALHIGNWNGSLTGGGSQQVVFGNSTAALTPAQLREIIFDYSGTQYPARILSNGEIVPDVAANASPLLSLQSQSGGAMKLNIGGVAGRSYEVQVSTDLVHWTDWTQMDSTGTNSVVDTNTMGCPQRFYRTRLLP